MAPFAVKARERFQPPVWWVDTVGGPAMVAEAHYPATLEGHGLDLRPWDEDLVRQMGQWQEYGFPYHAFDLGFLRDPDRAARELEKHSTPDQHRHFVACEGREAVGRVSVNLRDAAGLYLWAVHVPPEYQGRGVARRMLTVLIEWLERDQPGRDFVLTTNTFATRAHRAYRAVGFSVKETRWHYDRDIAAELWDASPERRAPLMPHMRFHNGRWEVRTYLMERPRGWRPLDA